MAGNQPQQRRPQGRESERGKSPDFVIRARQGPNSDFFVNVGAAWYVDVNGKQGISVKLNLLPIGSDGSFLMLPPKENGGE